MHKKETNVPIEVTEAYAKIWIGHRILLIEVNAKINTSIMSNIISLNTFKYLKGTSLKNTSILWFEFGGSSKEQAGVCCLGVRYGTIFTSASIHVVSPAKKNLFKPKICRRWDISKTYHWLKSKENALKARECILHQFPGIFDGIGCLLQNKCTLHKTSSCTSTLASFCSIERQVQDQTKFPHRSEYNNSCDQTHCMGQLICLHHKNY